MVDGPMCAATAALLHDSPVVVFVTRRNLSPSPLAGAIDTYMSADIIGAITLLSIAIHSYGLCLILNFKGTALAQYGLAYMIFTAIGVLIQIVFYEQDLSSQVGGLALGLWYGWAAKSLGEQIQAGIITRENPEGAPQAQPVIVMQPQMVVQQAMPVAAQAVPVQAQAVPVQAQAVPVAAQAVPVAAQAKGGAQGP
jgi:hypothetical protein